MITRIRKSDFTKHRFDEKSHPYVYKNVSDLNDKEMWKSLVSIGKGRGPFASFAKWLAPSFNLLHKNVGDLDREDYCINTQCAFADYDTMKFIVFKILTLAKHCEVW